MHTHTKCAHAVHARRDQRVFTILLSCKWVGQQLLIAILVLMRPWGIHIELPSVVQSNIASIPGRVFAFITVRRTTGPGTSCLRMRQIFIVYLWSAKIFNKSIMEICTQKMHRVSTQKMHIGSCFTKAWGVASCAAAQLQ